jgi:hypothetical protein
MLSLVYAPFSNLRPIQMLVALGHPPPFTDIRAFSGVPHSSGTLPLSVCHVGRFLRHPRRFERPQLRTALYFLHNRKPIYGRPCSLPRQGVPHFLHYRYPIEFALGCRSPFDAFPGSTSGHPGGRASIVSTSSCASEPPYVARASRSPNVPGTGEKAPPKLRAAVHEPEERELEQVARAVSLNPPARGRPHSGLDYSGWGRRRCYLFQSDALPLPLW